MTEIRTSVEISTGPDIYLVPETTESSDNPLGLMGNMRLRSGLATGPDHFLTYGVALGLHRVTGQLDVPNSKISDTYLGTTIPDDLQNCPDTTCYTSQNFNRTGFDATAFFSNQFGHWGFIVDMGARFQKYDNGHAYIDNDLMTADTVGIQHALGLSSGVLFRPAATYTTGPVTFSAGLDWSASTVRVTSPSGDRGKTHATDLQPFLGVTLQLHKTPVGKQTENLIDPKTPLEAPLPEPVTITPANPFTLDTTNLEIGFNKLSTLEIPFKGNADTLQILLAKSATDPSTEIPFEISADLLRLDLQHSITTVGEYKLIFTTESGASILTLKVLPVPAAPEIQKPVAPKVDVNGWE